MTDFVEQQFQLGSDDVTVTFSPCARSRRGTVLQIEVVRHCLEIARQSTVDIGDSHRCRAIRILNPTSLIPVKPFNEFMPCLLRWFRAVPKPRNWQINALRNCVSRSSRCQARDLPRLAVSRTESRVQRRKMGSSEVEHEPSGLEQPILRFGFNVLVFLIRTNMIHT